MRAISCLILISIFVCPAPALRAQDAVVTRPEIGQSGSDYLRSLRLRRIDPNVAYFDPSRPAPPLDTRYVPEAADKPGEEDSARLKWGAGLVSAVVLLAAIFILVRFGGAISVSLGADGRGAGRVARGLRPGEGDDPEVVLGLDRILAIADRREALVILARQALSGAAALDGVILQRSWTGRDALRQLSGGSARHLDALTSLVLASERVQFGNRDVREDEFRAHVDSVRPLLNGGSG